MHKGHSKSRGTEGTAVMDMDPAREKKDTGERLWIFCHESVNLWKASVKN